MTASEGQVPVEQLLPCPFCGGESKRFTIEEQGDNFGGDVIECQKFGASSHVEFGRKENLVSRWNTREAAATINTLKARVDEQRELVKGPLSWLEQWVDHADDCPNHGEVCTCGLTNVRHELHLVLQEPQDAQP